MSQLKHSPAAEPPVILVADADSEVVRKIKLPSAIQLVTLSFLCVSVLALVMGFALSSLLTRAVSEWEWENTAALARREVKQAGLDAVFTIPSGPEARERWGKEAFRLFASLPEVVRIKVWDREATVLWSDEAQLIGRRFPNNRELRAALAGKVAVQIKELNKSEHAYERGAFATLAEVYVPIFSEESGEVVGVVEVYKTPVRLLATIRWARIVIWTISIAGSVALYLALLPVFRHWQRVREETLREYAGKLEQATRAEAQELQSRTEQLQEALKAVEASQAGIAIENAHLYEDLARSKAYLQVLFDTARRAAESLNLSDILPQLVKSAADLVWADASSIRLLDPSGTALEAVAHHGLSEAFAGRGHLRVGEGVIGRVIRDGQPVVVEDLERDAQYVHQEQALAEGLRSVVMIPLRFRDQIVGALSVYSRAPRRYGEQEIDLLAQFGNLAAIAIENARLYQQAEERGDNLATLSTLTRLITSAPDSREAFHAVAEAAIILLGAKLAHVSVDDPECRVLRVQASSGIDPQWEQEVADLAVVPYGKGVVGSVFVSRTPEYLLDIQQDSRLLNRRLAGEAGLHAFAGIPLITGDRVVGVLSILFGDRGRFTPEEKELMSLLADQAAITIERARLFEELKRSYEEIQRTQDQLVQSTKFRALGEMAGGVAHDFNNLLTAVLGRAQYLLLQLEGGEVAAKEARRSLEVIERAALDGAETVRRLLEFTRATPRPGEVVAVDVNELLVQTMEVSRHRWKDAAEAKGQKIQVVLEPGEVPAVAGNPAELREVLLNLIFNAIDAMPQGGTLTLSSWAEGTRVCLRVGDTGVGMSPEVRQRIFDPFFTTKGPQSSGLGLSVSWGIVHRHDGGIVVDSQEGHGTTFTIKLPIRTPPAPAVEEVRSAHRGGRLRIIVIDDEPDVRETLRDILQTAGHEVWVAGSGPEGLNLLEGQQVDLVCTDLGMPGMTGWEVAERVKVRWPGVKVALITGWGVRVEPEELKAHGVDLLIAKPFQMKQILGTLSDFGLRENTSEAFPRKS